MAIETVQLSSRVVLFVLATAMGFRSTDYQLCLMILLKIYREFVPKNCSWILYMRILPAIQVQIQNLRQLSRDFPFISTAGKKDSN